MPIEDERYMAAALSLGRRGLGQTAPNPAVGALVVKDGVVVGRGATRPGGRPHAETIALAEAGPAARGATLYVTLEPCSHHGVTGPCCEAVVAAGISRLVYALADPNPVVAGRGAEFCAKHGIACIAGIGAAQAKHDHRGHILRVTAERPLVTLKLAETADGFVAGGPHDARLAITDIAANNVVHGMRATHDAIMVGIGTVIADDPLMTVRLPGVDAKPLRVVIDPELKTSPCSRLARTAKESPILILAAEGAVRDEYSLAAIDGIEIAAVATTPDGRLDLPSALRLLAIRGVTRVFSEGGPTVAAALLEGNLVDEMFLFTSPKALGRAGVPTLTAAARARLQNLHLIDEYEIGVDRLRHYVGAV